MNAESRNCQTSRDYNSSGPLLQGVMCDSAGICVSEADRARNTRKHDNDRAFSGSDSAGLGGRHLVEIQRLPVSRRMQATVSSMPQIGCCHTPGAMHLCLQLLIGKRFTIRQYAAGSPFERPVFRVEGRPQTTAFERGGEVTLRDFRPLAGICISERRRGCCGRQRPGGAAPGALPCECLFLQNAQSP